MEEPLHGVRRGGVHVPYGEDEGARPQRHPREHEGRAVAAVFRWASNSNALPAETRAGNHTPSRKGNLKRISGMFYEMKTSCLQIREQQFNICWEKFL